MSKEEIEAWNNQVVKKVNEMPKYYGFHFYLLILYGKYLNHELDEYIDQPTEHIRKL